MLKRKQYLYTLLGAIIAFLLFFIVAYLIVSLQMPDPNAGTAVTKDEQSTSTLVEIKEEVPRIEIYTNIIIKTVDEGHKEISRQSIPVWGLLGKDQQTIKKYFTDCEIVKFSEKEVLLEKVSKQNQTKDVKDRYTLGANEREEICIFDQQNKDNTVILSMTKKDVSPRDYSVLLSKIPITENEKKELQQNQNKIYKILQRYEQD